MRFHHYHTHITKDKISQTSDIFWFPHNVWDTNLQIKHMHGFLFTK